MDLRPGLSIVAPAATSEEAAAVVAALQRFISDTAPSVAAEPEPVSAWAHTALQEGVARQPGLLPPWV